MENSIYIIVISPMGLMLSICLKACLEVMRYYNNMPIKEIKKRCPHRLYAYPSRILDYILLTIDRWKLHNIGGVSGG